MVESRPSRTSASPAIADERRVDRLRVLSWVLTLCVTVPLGPALACLMIWPPKQQRAPLTMADRVAGAMFAVVLFAGSASFLWWSMRRAYRQRHDVPATNPVPAAVPLRPVVTRMVAPRPSPGSLPVILLPGLNGDPRVFARQIAVLSDARMVAWPPPEGDESLAEYVGRIARSLGDVGPCVIVGTSFGGIVAPELARHLDTRCCVLIASTHGPSGLPRSLRVARVLTAIVPHHLLWPAVRCTWSASLKLDLSRRLGRLPSDEQQFRRWAVGQLLVWRPTPSRSCPLVCIHGTRDRIFPSGKSTAEHVLPGGGHLITLTHGDEVNRILATILASVT